MSASSQPLGSGIYHRIVRTAGAQGVNQLARVVQLFLLVPICLAAWGTALYEDWLLLYSITAFLILADLGFLQFTTVKLIDAWSRGDKPRFLHEWRFALGLFGMLAAVLAAALAALWGLPGWTSLVPIRQMSAPAVATSVVLLCWAQVLTMLVNLGLVTYRARGDLSRSYHASTIFVVLQTAGIVIPPLFGGGPLGSAAGNCIGAAAMLAAVVGDFCWRYPDLIWKPKWPSFVVLYRGFPEAIGYLVSPVTTVVMLYGPNLVLAHVGAPEGAIALFTATRTVAGVARQLPYQFAHPAGVELAGLLARGDRQRLGQVYPNASRALAVIVGVLGGFIIVAGPHVMTLWTRGKIVYDPILMLVMLLTTAICAPSQVAYMLFWYGGFPGRLSRALIFSTVVAMAVASVLGYWFGVRGVAVGLGVGEIVGVAIYLSLLADRLLERESGRGLWRNFWTTFAAFSTSAGYGYLIDRLLNPRDWLGLIELGVAWGVVATVGVYLIFLNRSQQALVTGMAVNLARYTRVKWSIK